MIIRQGLPRVTVFLEQVVASLPDWAASLQPFPVVTWTQFVSYLHTVVNPLAGEEHLKEVIQQLQLMGEVVYLKCEETDLIILQPRFVCSTLCGQLLSPEYQAEAIKTGSYTRDQFQLANPGFDAKDVLMVLSALGICTEVRTEEDDTEYEFPCYKLGPGTEAVTGWVRDEHKWAEYGGVSLAAAPGLAMVMWPRVQTMIRRSVTRKPEDLELVQTRGATSLMSPPLEALVEHRGDNIQVRVRGPEGSKRACFYFLEEILGIIDQVLLEMSPGLPVDKIILSSADLKAHKSHPMQWTPGHVMKAMMEGGWSAELRPGESLASVLCFDCDSVSAGLVPGPDLHVSSMSTVTRQSLCTLLDPPHAMGRDWCMLAVQTGLSHKVPKLDIGSGNYSQTARLLDEWAHEASSTVGQLTRLQTLGIQYYNIHIHMYVYTYLYVSSIVLH